MNIYSKDLINLHVQKLSTGVYVDLTPEELQAHKAWLKHSSEPWTKVLELWDITAKLRYQEFHDGGEASIAQTLKEWPRYKDPYGYSLVSFNNYYYIIIIIIIVLNMHIQNDKFCWYVHIVV